MHDLRLAVRALRQTPVVSIVAILSLALGIGANTAIFSLVNSLLLRTLPVREPAQLALVSYGTFTNPGWTYAIWDQIQQRAQAFDGAMAWGTQRFNLAEAGEMQPVDGVFASGDFFTTLGVPALIGRTFTEADDVRGGGPDGAVAVISYGFWQRRFGGAANAIGSRLVVERVPFTIVGVTPPDFLGAEIGRAFDVALPIGTEPLIRGRDTALDRRSMWWLTVMVRLKPGQSIESATAALRGMQPQIRENAMPQDWKPQQQEGFLREAFTLAPAATGTSGLRSRYERPLLTILVVVALVLLIACANIANLLLARANARRHELSVRLALGAPRWRLARQLLVESLVLSAAGAAAGVLFALWGSRALVAQLSTQANRVVLDLALDWRVMAFTAAVTIATAVLFGTAPAFRATRVAPIDALKEHGRSAAGDARAGLSSVLVIAQVALSLLLAVAAGLFVRTFSHLADVSLGFDSDRILVVNISAMQSQVNAAGRVGLYVHLAEALDGLPGVARAAASVVTPVSGSTWNNRILVPGAPEMPERERTSLVNIVTPGWFAAYGTRFVAGRDFDTRDRQGALPVMIVNEAFARKFFSGKSAMGGVVTFPTGNLNIQPPRTVVGIVADAVYRNLREPIGPTMYFPLMQYNFYNFPLSGISISLRASATSPALLSRSVATTLTTVDRNLAFNFRPLADQVSASLTQERMVALLAGFFGGLALLLAGLGLYGVTAYAVSRRRTEIGIRMALGAAPAGVVRFVLWRVAILVGAGVLLGAGASLWASKFVTALLYGLEPRDPVTIAGATLVLAIVGALAGWLPAHRASCIDPAAVLRDS